MITAQTYFYDDRNRTDYIDGFGDSEKEYWIGLGVLHRLTADGSQELHVEMTDTFGEFARAEYNRFVVEGEATNFTLDVGGFRGSTVAADRCCRASWTDTPTRWPAA